MEVGDDLVQHPDVLLGEFKVVEIFLMAHLGRVNPHFSKRLFYIINIILEVMDDTEETGTQSQQRRAKSAITTAHAKGSCGGLYAFEDSGGWLPRVRLS